MSLKPAAKPVAKKAVPPVAPVAAKKTLGAAPGGYASQKAATAPKPGGLLGKLESAGHKAGAAIAHEAHEVEDAAMNAGGAAIGLAEMVGMRYPVKAYEAQVSGQLYRGSRVDAQGMAALKQQGVKGVVNLCKEADMDSANAAALGLKALHIPILDNTAPTMGQVQQFLDFVRGTPPAYVHCEAGKGRTGTMVACYRIAAQGWSADKALDEAKSFGLAMPCQIAFIQQFAKAQGQKVATPVHAS
jgi:protein tyrosine phosphatase (PTP) superfamily phosphohydrolase (DUF442 family)